MISTAGFLVSLCLFRGIVIVCTVDGRLHGIDGETGIHKWTVQTGKQIVSSAAINGEDEHGVADSHTRFHIIPSIG